VGKTRTPLTLFLMSGVKLQGVVTWFGSFSTLLKQGAESQLVYKHAISTIMSLESIQLSEHGDEPETRPQVSIRSHVEAMADECA
jgi:host factor-I protein